MTSFSKYESLVTVLDCLRKEAPARYRRYHARDNEIEAVNQARSRAFLHLYLKVRFGLLDFEERERVVTDGMGDGGIDAYFIDTDRKKVTFIQAKFRTNKRNFEEKHLTFDDLMVMDVDRIVEGQTADEEGTAYNGKIRQLQRDVSAVPDIGRYSYEVVLLANLGKTTPSRLKKLTGGFVAEVFDFDRTYEELVFPVVSGTYYNEPALSITLNLRNTAPSSARISYTVATTFKPCDISIVFVPTSEIGRILYQYKNSILKFNPRSYLELARNAVNRDISHTITDNDTNEFALFNNGITMLSEETNFNERVGARDVAKVIVTNPQIINGGQTAYTLSRLYEQMCKGERDEKLFEQKEVLLKIITFSPAPTDDPGARMALIEAISKATNSQTQVTDADRRSNDTIQIDIQREMFRRYGHYYERKLGEFADGLRDGYIDRAQVLDREIFLRVCMACDFRVSEARRNSAKQIFAEDSFTRTLRSTSRIPEFFFAYCYHTALTAIERTFSRDRQNRYGVANFGQALRYGKFAVVAVCNALTKGHEPEGSTALVERVLEQWLTFEANAVSKHTNRDYFATYKDPETGENRQELNFSGYYKGSTIADDLRAHFKIQREQSRGRVRK